MIPAPPRIRPLLVLALAAAAAGCVRASAGPGPGYPPGLHPEQRIPGDTTVVTGRFLNGLTYYVRANREPPGRAELRLVVNAGSILEDESQLGVAHFVEHMAFNGTRRFAEHQLVDYLESVGMRFGPDINASTGFDETIYTLTLPVDSPLVLEKGLDILEDWATGIAFDPREVEAERGVVIEEWRLGRGASARVQEKHLPVLFERSRYARRLPIGDPELLRRVGADELRRFYRDWYRPDLMAVVAVGDFDVERVRRLISERFARIQPRDSARVRGRFPVPTGDRTRVAVVSDPELSSSTVSLVHTVPARNRGTVGRYRDGIVESLYAGMMSHRLNELAQRPDAPFLGVSSFHGSLVRPLDAFVLSADAPESGTARALATLVAEAERVARHGFTAGELEREKADVMRAWEQIHVERGKTTSSQHADQYAAHYLYGGPILTVESEYAMQRALVPRVAIEEVNARARAWLRVRARSILVSVPDKAGLAAPSEARLRAVLDSVSRARLEPWAETVSDAPLVARPPAPGRVVAERTHAGGIVEWTLSNGVRVLLRTTDFREDEVLLAARSPGGTSVVPDSSFLDAQTATAAVQVGGVGDLSVVDLQKRLAGKSAAVGPDVSELWEGMSGTASPRDLETMLQLVWLYFTRPRRDPQAWEAYRQRARESLRNRGASPESAFQDTVLRLLTRDHPRARPITRESFDRVDLDRSLAVYRDRFADAGDFTFYLVGRMTPDSVRPLVERWLGALPSTGRKETWRDVGITPPPGVERATVRRGLEPKGRTQLVFSGPAEFGPGTGGALRTLADVLELRLRERLREDLGGTYGVGVGGSAQRDPRGAYRFVIDFGAAPERLPELTRVVFAEIDSLKAAGPSEKDLQKVREAQRRAREIERRENHWWLLQILAHDRYGWDFAAIGRDARTEGITAAAVRDAARRYLDVGRYVQVTLMPEGPVPGDAAAPRVPSP